jgi:hypothetical protein
MNPSSKTYYIPANFRLTAPKNAHGQEDWKVVKTDVPQMGTKRGEVIKDLNRDYGFLNWRFAWQIDNQKYVPFKEAVAIYEEAYENHLKANPNKIEYLITNASDVYDNDESNVRSGTNYYKQGKKLTHLQDISIRRVMAKLGHSFEGDTLVRVRKSRNSNQIGRSLSPKLIDFHRPEMVKDFQKNDLKPLPSIEDFWQLNRVIQFSDSLARLQPKERLAFVEDPKTFN